jgi:dihydroorotate dehydrogenase
VTLAGLAFPLVRPLIQKLEAEKAHSLTVAVMKALPPASPARPGALAVSAFGLDFPNPVGLAAGFDKNAEVPDAMLGEGFGFVEVGTITPRPQGGNPRPRLFRLIADRAAINRMGFNNQGHAAALARLEARRGRTGIVGVNIGANKDSADRMADYVKGIEAFAGIAGYLTVNISSPNTPGLRALQSRAELQALLDRLNEARQRQPRQPPMLLKIAPDLRADELEDVALCCAGGAVDGIIVSNTTLSRDGVTSPLKSEAGGLSGAPLFALSTRQLARLHVATGGRIPLVGAGGIDGPDAAWRKIEAGACLLQLYTAMIYRGPALVGDILAGLEQRLRAEGATSLDAIRGRAAAALTRD